MRIFEIINYEDKKIVRIMGIKATFKKKNATFSHKIKDFINIKKFSDFKVRKNSVLIVEPNSYHGEILPGFVKYFQDLGFNVDLLLRHENFEDNPFINVKNINIFSLSANKIKEVLKFQKINNYEFLFISTTSYMEKQGFQGYYLDYLNYLPKTKRGILQVEHTFDENNKKRELDYLKQNRLFTLSGFDNTLMLNPHYFAQIEPNHEKIKKTKFLISGHWAKGNELLIKTVEALAKEGLENFEIRVLGSRIHIPKELKKYFKILGYVKFKTLYEELKNIDFILPMLDEFDENHKHYLTGTTSGSKQQSLGFLKPLLINEKFAKEYGFNNKNSIVYRENNLLGSMKNAIKMSQDRYTQMQVFLENLATETYNESLNNLRKVVKNEILF